MKSTGISNPHVFGRTFLSGDTNLVARHLATLEPTTPTMVLTLNTDQAMRIDSEPSGILRDLYKDPSSFVTIDGFPILALARFHKVRIFRNTGADLLPQLLQVLEEENKSVVIISSSDTGAIESHHRKGTIVLPAPILSSEEQAENWLKSFDDRLNSVSAIIVSLGSPAQEILATCIKKRNLNVVCCLFGGAMDFHTKRKTRAPYLMRRAGIEWVYRMIVEDKRLAKRYVKNLRWLINRGFRFKIV